MSNDDSNSAQPSNIISLHPFPFPIKNIPRSDRPILISWIRERLEESLFFLKNVLRGRSKRCRSHRTPSRKLSKMQQQEVSLSIRLRATSVGARARVHAVCQCAGLDSRGFNTLYRGDCCSLSACSTQPNDRLSSHRGAQPPFVGTT